MELINKMIDKKINKKKANEEEFRAKFMELQTGIISLCLEFTNSDVDYIYAYASMEESSYMFNAFFKKGDEILRIEEINEDHDLAWEFLDLGIEDLKKIRFLCEEYHVTRPKEMKMYYDVKTGKYKADFKYESTCTLENGLDESEIFDDWVDDIKKQIKK